MQLTPLESISQLDEIGKSGTLVILKHNHTCSISKGVLDRMSASAVDLPRAFLLDIHSGRDISNDITGRFGIPHQSPQLLVIRDGQCIYHEWGFDISAEKAAEAVGKS